MKKHYRSLLFVPAEKKKLLKIYAVNADCVIVDLEDAILDSQKDEALLELEKFLDSYTYDIDIYVRLNPDRIEIETSALNKYNISGFMLPKTESIKDIENFRKYVLDKKLIVLLESPLGMINIREIVSKSDMVAFGAEDYTGQTDIKNESKYLSYVKSMIVTYAKAFNKDVFDTISLNYRDVDEYESDVIETKNYGFTGKLAIHPKQVDIINEVYKDQNIEYYRYVLQGYNKSGLAVFNIDGKIYEKPHIEALKKKIEEYENAEN